MIDPTQITNYNRTEAELEEFLMFAILVAGKTAKTQAQKLENFLNPMMSTMGLTPFGVLEQMVKTASLGTQMKFGRLGQYKRIETAFRQILTFKGDLKKVSVQDLESIKGIGPKTARFFILHSRPNAQIACLDVHILKWLAKETRIGMPKATPSGKKYAEIEQLFLTEASIRGMAPADLDLQIWKSFSQKTLA
jgi:thermostable 8-oxoguanine DNA glycosylase